MTNPNPKGGTGAREFCKHGTHESQSCGSCNMETIKTLQAERDKLAASLDVLMEAFKKAGLAKCPDHVAHPQSVWFHKHVQTPLQNAYDQALAQAKEVRGE